MPVLGSLVKFKHKKKTVSGIEVDQYYFGQVIAISKSSERKIYWLSVIGSNDIGMTNLKQADFAPQTWDYSEIKPNSRLIDKKEEELEEIKLSFELKTKVSGSFGEGEIVGYSPGAREYLVQCDPKVIGCFFSNRETLVNNNLVASDFKESYYLRWARPSTLRVLDSQRVEQKPVEQKQEDSKIMSNNDAMSKFLTNLKQDAKNAGFRVAANQTARTVRKLLVKLLREHNVEKSQINAVRSLLDTDLGEAAISYAIGVALTYAPKIKDDPRFQQMAAEFRIEGMAGAGNIAIDNLLANIAPGIMQAMSNLPSVELPQEVEVVKEKVVINKQ